MIHSLGCHCLSHVSFLNALEILYAIQVCSCYSQRSPCLAINGESKSRSRLSCFITFLLVKEDGSRNYEHGGIYRTSFDGNLFSLDEAGKGCHAFIFGGDIVLDQSLFMALELCMQWELKYKCNEVGVAWEI